MSEPEDQIAPALSVALIVDRPTIERLRVPLRRLIIGLIDEAVRVTLIAPDAVQFPGVLAGSIAHHPLPRVGWPVTGRAVRQLAGRLGQTRFDLVHSLSGSQASLADRLADRLDTPLLVSIADRRHVDRLVGHIWRNQTHLLTMTEPMRQLAADRLAVNPQRLHVIRPGLPAAAATACYALETRTAAILTTGGLTSDCGVDRLISAFAALIAQGLDALLFVVGAGPAEPALREQTRRLGLGQRVTFAPPTSDASGVLSAADLFVLPRRESSVCLESLEAMAAGLAVVAADGGVADWLLDETTALLYAPSAAVPAAGHEEQLVLQIRRLIEDRPAARRLAGNARQHVREHHAISRMTSATIQLYRELALARKTLPVGPAAT